MVAPRRRLATTSTAGVVRLWAISADPQVQLAIHHFRGGAWCVIDADGRPRRCGGEVWRWLRWRCRDPVSGTSALLAAEHFGPLPGIGRPA